MLRTLQFITGLTLAVAAGTLIYEGSILGEDTASIALVTGIIGVLLIATSKIRLLK